MFTRKPSLCFISLLLILHFTPPILSHSFLFPLFAPWTNRSRTGDPPLPQKFGFKPITSSLLLPPHALSILAETPVKGDNWETSVLRAASTNRRGEPQRSVRTWHKAKKKPRWSCQRWLKNFFLKKPIHQSSLTPACGMLPSVKPAPHCRWYGICRPLLALSPSHFTVNEPCTQY